MKTEIFQLVMRIYKRDKAVFALTNEGYKALTAYVEDPTPLKPPITSEVKHDQRYHG